MTPDLFLRSYYRPVLRIAVLTTAVVMLASGQQQSVFRSATRTVPVYATVVDQNGRLVSNLSKSDFEITDDGKPVAITTFSNDNLPITVVLMLDMSESMMNERERVRQAAQRFVAVLQPGDRVRLGTFGDEIGISPWLTGDKTLLGRILQEEVWAGGQTPLWSAVRAAMTSIADEPGRRVVLVLTDGANSCGLKIIGQLDAIAMPSVRPGSTAVYREPSPAAEDPGNEACARFEDVQKMAVNDEFMFYVIGVEGPGLAGLAPGLADETGGGHFEMKRNADLGATITRVADELHHQYAIGFPALNLDGRLHTIGIRVNRDGLSARARKSYLALGERQ